MLLEDRIEPLARALADAVSRNGGYGGVWDGFRLEEDLIPVWRPNDTQVDFVRAKNHEAKIALSNIRTGAPDPKSIVFHPSIILKTETKAGDVSSLKNDTSVEQSLEFSRTFNNGENESDAISAGASFSSTTSAGGSGLGIEVSQEFSAEVHSEWQRQTGTTRDQSVGGTFPLIVPPWTFVEAQLMWEEQVQQRRLECFGSYDCDIKIGRHRRVKRWHTRKARHHYPYEWTSGSVAWASVEHLLAVMEKRGSVHHALYNHFARRHSIHPGFVKTIKERRRIPIDQLTPPFKGAQNIRVVIRETKSIEAPDTQGV